MKLVRLLSVGEYSDYTILGLHLVDCESGEAWLREAVAEYRREHPEAQSERRFYAWLKTRPGFESVDFEEWFLGDYGHLNPKVREGPEEP